MLRLFYSLPARTPTQLTLTEDDFHHAKSVLRIKPGVTIEISDGVTLYTAEIQAVSGLELTLDIINQSDAMPNPVDITLVQALPKGDKMSDILKKCTEIGVSQFVPVTSQRSIPKIDAKKEHQKRIRWQSIIKSAAMQSKQLQPPKLAPIGALTELSKALSLTNYDLKLVFWEDETHTSLKQALTQFPSPQKIVMVIGPEGGLDADEVAHLNQLGFVNASLGHTVLRVENAALVAASQLGYHYT